MTAPTLPAPTTQAVPQLRPPRPRPATRYSSAAAWVDALLCERCNQSKVARLCRCPRPATTPVSDTTPKALR